MSHLENVSEDEIDRLLGMVVDVENLFMSVHKEEDTDTKQVYFYLFKVSKGFVPRRWCWEEPEHKSKRDGVVLFSCRSLKSLKRH